MPPGCPLPPGTLKSALGNTIDPLLQISRPAWAAFRNRPPAAQPGTLEIAPQLCLSHWSCIASNMAMLASPGTPKQNAGYQCFNSIDYRIHGASQGRVGQPFPKSPPISKLSVAKCNLGEEPSEPTPLLGNPPEVLSEESLIVALNNTSRGRGVPGHGDPNSKPSGDQSLPMFLPKVGTRKSRER